MYTPRITRNDWQQHRPGDVASVTVNRKGTERDLRVVLKNKAGNTEVAQKEATQAAELLGADPKCLEYRRM